MIRICLRYFFLIAILSLFQEELSAQEYLRWPRKFRAGDECYHFFLDEWREAVVTALKGSKVEVEFTFADMSQREVADCRDLRFRWEIRALHGKRVWKDDSGQFTVEAVPVGFNFDTNEITLHRLDNDLEINVGIDKLGKADREFVAKLKGVAAQRPSELTEVVEFEFEKGQSMKAWGNSDETAEKVSPDPPATTVTLPMAGASFPRLDFHETIVRIIGVGGPEGWMAVGTRTTFEDKPGRILWLSMTGKKLVRQHVLPATEMLLAVEPPARMALTSSRERMQADDENTLTLWASDPSRDVPTPVVRWKSNDAGARTSDKYYAEIVSDDRVFHRWRRAGYVMWDIGKRKSVFQVGQESFFEADPVISPGRKWIALPEDQRVRVLNAETGDTVAVLPIEGNTSGVGFDPTGSRLFACSSEQIVIWSLGTSNPPRVLPSSRAVSPFGATIQPIDDSYLFIGRSDGRSWVLYDMAREIPVWEYAVSFATQSTASNETRRDGTINVVDNKLCYSVGSPNDPNFIIGAVDLPGEGVMETLKRVNYENVYVMGAGARVKIEVDCGQYDSRIESSLTSLAERNGWVLDSPAEYTLKARMYVGETQTATYQSPDGRESQSLSITPKISEFQLLDTKGKVIWSNATSSGGLPPVIFVRNGSIQDRIASNQAENPGFFDDLNVPAKFRNPAYDNGFGTTTAGIRGLVVTDVRLPPGSEEAHVEKEN